MQFKVFMDVGVQVRQLNDIPIQLTVEPGGSLQSRDECERAIIDVKQMLSMGILLERM